MFIMTDGKKTVSVELKRWNGSGYDPDWAEGYFSLPADQFDTASGMWNVESVDELLDIARSSGPEGARTVPEMELIIKNLKGPKKAK